MSNKYSQFEQRKRDHIELALMKENQADEQHELDAVTLWHEALPDLNMDEVQLTSRRFGREVPHPFMVSSMTAGHGDAHVINHHLMAAASEKNWVMGVGSQRRELTDPDAMKEWVGLRRDYPSVSLYSNLGIAQLIHTPLDSIFRLIDNIQADALIIHCNSLQESIQPEGTPFFKGCWHALEQLIQAMSLPVIVKETGSGFSSTTLARLNGMGVAAVDVSGLGGTHWGRIEGHRAVNDPLRQRAAETFRQWGVGTVSAVRHAYALSPDFEIWGSGGVRHGLDAAKLIALGATTVSYAKPLLAAAMQSVDQVLTAMNIIEYELKVALFCTGSCTLSELKEKVRCLSEK